MSSLLLSFSDVVGSLLSPLLCSVLDYLIVTPSPIFPPLFPSFTLRREALARSLLFPPDVYRFRDLLRATTGDLCAGRPHPHPASRTSGKLPQPPVPGSLSFVIAAVHVGLHQRLVTTTLLHQPPPSLAFSETAVWRHVWHRCIEAIPLAYRRTASRRLLRLTSWHCASQIENGGG